jgi:ATP-binding cassette subfamily B protein
VRTVFRQAGPYLWRYRKGLAVGIGALIIKDVAGAGLPLAIRSGVDALTRGFSLSIVFEFAGLIVALSLIKGLFQ